MTLMVIMPRSVLSLVAALGFTAKLAAQPDGGQELLDFIRDAHKASRESIRTCSCRVEFTSTNHAAKLEKDRKQTMSGRFWYDTDCVRGRISTGREEDFVWRNSTNEGVSRKTEDGKPVAGAYRNADPYRFRTRDDAWVRGMLVFHLPYSIKHVPFEQLVERATRFDGAKWKELDGRKLGLVTLHFDPPEEKSGEWDLEIYFDPSINYLARKAIYNCKSGKNRLQNQDEIVQFKECSPGLFFPERGVGRSGSPEDWRFEYTATISEIEINKPLPENIFRMRYPMNIIMTDTIRGTTYRIDENGNRISEETPLGKAAIPPPSASPLSSEPNTETREEPQSWTRWILPFSLASIAIGTLAAYIRYRNKPVVDN